MAQVNSQPSLTAGGATGTLMVRPIVLCGLTQKFSSPESGKEVFADLLLTKDPKIFMLGFSLKDEQNKGLSFYGKHRSNVHPNPTSPSRPPVPVAGPPEPPPSPEPQRGPRHAHPAPLFPPAADKAEVTEEQMRVFHEAITCLGMQTSEINYTDAKKVNAVQTRLCPPSEPSCLGAAPEAWIGRPAGQGCIVRQDVLLLSTCLPAGTAELPRGPKVEGPGGKVPGEQGGQEGRRNSGNRVAVGI